MASAAELGLVAGGITAANEALFAPLSGHGTPWQNFNWRVLPATGILALLLWGLDNVSHSLAMGIGAATIATTLVVPLGKAGAPLTNVATVLGQGHGAKK